MRSSSPKHASNDLFRTPAQKVDQQRNTIQILRPFGRSIDGNARKVPVEITRKVCGQPGREIADQAVTRDLRWRSN